MCVCVCVCVCVEIHVEVMTCSERLQDLGDTSCVKSRDDLASFTVCCRLLKEAARLDDGRVEVSISVGE